MMEIKKAKALFIPIIIPIIMVYVLFIAITWIYASTHESAHEQIAIHNGCINYTTNIGLRPYFVCHEYKDSKYNETEYLLNGLNEVVGYNILSIVFAILGSTFLIIWTMIITRRDE